MEPQPPQQPQQYQQPQNFQQQYPSGYAQQAYYPPQRQGMSGLKLGLIIGGVVLGVLFLGGVLVGVLAVATIPKLAEAKEKIEVNQMDDLYTGLRQVLVDDKKKARLRDGRARSSKGSSFWEAAFDESILDSAQATRVVSVMGADKPGSARPVPASSVSYTAPKGDELLRVMMLYGPDRCVLFTWNSRNWRNANGERIPVAWSDSDTIQWLTFQQAASDYGITQAEWDDPAGKLFGKKAPFQFTYE